MAELEAVDLTAPDGTRIRRWGRVPPDASRAVCFVHGATYGGRAAFDAEGVSWLSAVAANGPAAYAVDVRGYGDSGRPPQLDEPAEANEPVVRASAAARDVAAVLDDLDETYDVVHLVGYSWGSIICGTAVAELGVDVESLVLYGAVYRPPEAHRGRRSPGELSAAYRRVTKEDARERWAAQRPDETVPEDAFEAFWEALVASGQRVDGREIVAPNGTLVDLGDAIDRPLYDAGAIHVPTLVVRGSLDTASTREDALGLFDAVGANDKDYVEIAGGSHFLQLEPRRDALFGVVENFQRRVDGGAA